jgi:D-sedoheptulose 7-phosphate isomerase
MNPLDDLTTRYPQLSPCRGDIESACDLLLRTFDGGNRLYICGNGGSAADALHIVGELAKSFTMARPLDESFVGCASKLFGDGADYQSPGNGGGAELSRYTIGADILRNLQGALPAFALVENTALATAFANDCASEYVFAQQVYAYAREGDCVWGISTSGNSVNILHALAAAKGRGASTLGLTGASGGKMKALCDACICVPETETYLVQELHLPVYHAICLALEEHFWG